MSAVNLRARFPDDPGMRLCHETPWQRGSNENANGLLRQYFPQGTNLNVFSPQHLQAVEDEINNRPRLILAHRTPAELFAVAEPFIVGRE